MEKIRKLSNIKKNMNYLTNDFLGLITEEITVIKLKITLVNVVLIYMVNINLMFSMLFFYQKIKKYTSIE
jgi:hypothetical protein